MPGTKFYHERGQLQPRREPVPALVADVAALEPDLAQNLGRPAAGSRHQRLHRRVLVGSVERVEQQRQRHRRP